MCRRPNCAAPAFLHPSATLLSQAGEAGQVLRRGIQGGAGRRCAPRNPAADVTNHKLPQAGQAGQAGGQVG